jgi:hypothetical protein
MAAAEGTPPARRTSPKRLLSIGEPWHAEGVQTRVVFVTEGPGVELPLHQGFLCGMRHCRDWIAADPLAVVREAGCRHPVSLATPTDHSNVNVCLLSRPRKAHQFKVPALCATPTTPG